MANAPWHKVKQDVSWSKVKEQVNRGVPLGLCHGNPVSGTNYQGTESTGSGSQETAKPFAERTALKVTKSPLVNSSTMKAAEKTEKAGRKAADKTEKAAMKAEASDNAKDA